MFEAFFAKTQAFVVKTQVVQQVSEMHYRQLFVNPYFYAPIVLLTAYLLYKQSFKRVGALVVLLVTGWFIDTPYFRTAIVGEQLQLDKVLPLIGVGLVVFGLEMYLFFSDEA